MGFARLALVLLVGVAVCSASDDDSVTCDGTSHEKLVCCLSKESWFSRIRDELDPLLVAAGDCGINLSKCCSAINKLVTTYCPLLRQESTEEGALVRQKQVFIALFMGALRAVESGVVEFGSAKLDKISTLLLQPDATEAVLALRDHVKNFEVSDTVQYVLCKAGVQTACNDVKDLDFSCDEECLQALALNHMGLKSVEGVESWLKRGYDDAVLAGEGSMFESLLETMRDAYGSNVFMMPEFEKAFPRRGSHGLKALMDVQATLGNAMAEVWSYSSIFPDEDAYKKLIENEACSKHDYQLFMTYNCIRFRKPFFALEIVKTLAAAVKCDINQFQDRLINNGDVNFAKFTRLCSRTPYVPESEPQTDAERKVEKDKRAAHDKRSYDPNCTEDGFGWPIDEDVWSNPDLLDFQPCHNAVRAAKGLEEDSSDEVQSPVSSSTPPSPQKV